MDLRRAVNWIRHECLSYQLPGDKQKFDDEKGEVLDFLESDVVENKIKKTIEVKVLASNEEVVAELAEEIEINANSKNFDRGIIRVVSTHWAKGED
jgi:hypothetical protein